MMPSSTTMVSTKNTTNSSNSSNLYTSNDFMMKEVERFQSFYKDMLKLHELLENIEHISTRRQFREVINRIEDDFVNEPELTTPKCLMYNSLRLGVIGGSLSGKTAFIQRYITGKYQPDDFLPGKHKKIIDVNGSQNLLLIRDETGPPDPQFSMWVDAVVLVFNLADELSFNVISNYYAKMVQQRSDRELPCVLVAIKDVDQYDACQPTVDDSRVKKFISDHRKCPFFVVSLESGENVDEVFQVAAEKILQDQSFPSISSYDNLLSSSVTSFATIDGFSTLQKKFKRRNTLFNMKSEKKEEVMSRDDIGSGRTIPVKQGYLYKRTQNGIKDFRKKYVIITDNQVFKYYPSMKEYMEDSNAKSIRLIHTSIKVPGGDKKRLIPNQGPLHQRSNSKSSNFLSSPIKSRSQRNSSCDPIDNENCYVITNSSISDQSSQMDTCNGSPTIAHIPIERSFSDGQNLGPLPLRTVQSQETVTPFKLKHKHSRKQNSNRYKSCEIDYHVNGTLSDDGRPASGTPLISRKRSLKEKRQQKSCSNLKDVGQITDTEDCDCVFSLVNIHGKCWDFECPSLEERDEWIQTIEQQILKAFQDNNHRSSLLSEEDSESSPTQNGFNIQEKLFTIPGNEKCADCDAPGPEWSSLNIGVLICIECSGVHRNLGSHLSRVRSVLLDDWPPESVRVLSSLGNTFINNLYESNIKDNNKPKPTASREERERWVNRKYEKKEFMLPLNTENIGHELAQSVAEDDIQRVYSKLIYSSSANINSISNVQGYNYKLAPLHISCAKANIPITQLLLWYNSDPKILDERGYNPIYYANKSNSKECADLLYSYGCPEDTPC